MLLVLESITWKPHLETAMEVALTRHAKGEDVVFAHLRGALNACEDDKGIHALLDLPKIRISRGLRLLRAQGIACESPARDAAALARSSRLAGEMLQGCRNLEDLKRLSYKSYGDIGWGALSSVISITNKSSVSLLDDRRLLRTFLQSAILAYDLSEELISRHRPDQVLLFNGRFASTRAALRAAQAQGVRWLLHERGGDKYRYLVADFVLHDIAAISTEIRRHWRPDQAADGHAFFRGRRERVERAWHSFAKHQSTGALPQQMQEDGTDWITFFTSSEDEMAAIGDSVTSSVFPDQVEAIKLVAEIVKDMPGTRLCVRVHPHIAQKSEADQQKWSSLNLPGVIVLGPRDRSDSYALVERSKVVCTYGSTVGVEATYWGVPSLLFGRAFYESLGVCEIAADREQVVRFLRAPTTRSQDSALPYGAYWERLGQPFHYYKPEGLHRGSILGHYLDDAISVRLAKRIAGVVRSVVGRPD